MFHSCVLFTLVYKKDVETFNSVASREQLLVRVFETNIEGLCQQEVSV